MRRVVRACLGLALATACTGTSADQPRGSSSGSAASAAPSKVSIPPLRHRIRPDVLILSPLSLTPAQLSGLRGLAKGGIATIRTGTGTVGGERVRVLGVDPGTFRSFAPQGTAEATPVWESVARDEAVVAHDVAAKRKLTLGAQVEVRLHGVRSLRLGALATTTLPDVGLLVSDRVGASIGLPPMSGAVLSSGRGDPTTLASAVRRIVGPKAHLHLLSQPTTPYAFLTGAGAAKAFGAFSYRYYADGTIEPDARWVAEHITSGQVPILGVVTCHRLMFPQLRAALTEVQRSGLAATIKTGQYGGCYVPRFIERNPSRSISLHTWGIAIDLNVPENLPGSRSRLNPRLVSIFKKWGFRWGGDWRPTDPMHFELGALLTVK